MKIKEDTIQHRLNLRNLNNGNMNRDFLVNSAKDFMLLLVPTQPLCLLLPNLSHVLNHQLFLEDLQLHLLTKKKKGKRFFDPPHLDHPTIDLVEVRIRRRRR